ncbi:STAS domain-containing protein [Thalassorhabdus alkalitolerans]|uniref:STAS domain-containing protein n=1 Tax=Thalassorhabdus alkalitolerans TaxID=2282697 RepID=A0ABW0YKR8_9BACI
MGLILEEEYIDYFTSQRSAFQEKLLNEAVNVRDKIHDILLIGNIDLLNNAHKLVMYVLSGELKALDEFAQKEGISWASQDLTLAFKLEWVQAIRRTVWNFLQRYDLEREGESYRNFYELEEKVNDRIDQFLNGFFLSYSDYKDQLIESQRKIVEELSVPIIPVTSTVGVVPLIREINLSRANIIEEKILNEIERLRIQTLIMDFSGITSVEKGVLSHLMKMIDETKMMGCECVITGLGPKIVMEITKLGIQIHSQAKTKGSLQQALEDYLVSSI